MKLKIIYNDIKFVVINSILITFNVRLTDEVLDEDPQVIVYWGPSSSTGIRSLARHGHFPRV